MKKAILILFVLALVLFVNVVKADFTFGRALPFIPEVGIRDSICCFSYDGLEMYLNGEGSGEDDRADLWVSKRNSKDEEWGAPENLGSAVNSPFEDSLACISADGLTLYFQSNRPGGYGSYDIYKTTRPDKNSPWDLAVSMGPEINSSSSDLTPWITADGLEFYFSSWRSGGYGLSDLYVSKRDSTSDPWGQSVNIGPVVNSAYHEQYVTLSQDGLLLLFCELPSYFRNDPFRPGGFGDCDIWMARRASLSDHWQAPVNPGKMVNGQFEDWQPVLSPEQNTLYFSTWFNKQAPIIPIVDLNADGIVDAADMCIIVDNWGTDNSLCDIGPMPWGDGIVDVEDLIVLAEHLFEEIPPVE